ncbi:MAG: lysine-2,3-aminomutase-like protein [Lentisphaeraceae bacterium]|nr:lysine-2,3-aminomutase-like protein [Lentisphaeraceae bacterium]
MSKEIVIKNVQQLKDQGLISAQDSRNLKEVADRFSVSITPSIIKNINTEAENAIFTQYVPSSEELEISEDELSDPIGDDAFSPVKGITHRYPDRLLLKPIHTCAVYCRFCFRREKVGRSDQALNSKELKEALSYIKDNKEVWEVILSGGDPLVLSPSKISKLFLELEKIEHVKVIRIHTRVPLVAPEKICAELLQSLKTKKALYIVIHCNSHEELSEEVCESLGMLVKAGIPLLSQSVLLRNVNDDAVLLEKLFRKLVENRVKPYYLHHADKAEGTAHFRTSIAEGQEYMSRLRGKVSGICQPTYVLDIPGGKGKVPIGPDYLQDVSEGYKVKDWKGCEHIYKD